jgi:tetratricopeptide (TPR) repeat protein
MKKLFVLIASILFTSFLLIAQEKIGTNTFLYGDLKNAVKGKVLIWYGIDDPKGESEAISIFSNHGYDAKSWNKLFMPGQQYSTNELNEKIRKDNIETIIFIKHNGTSTYQQGSFNTKYNSFSNSLMTNGNSYNVVGKVSLVFEVYAREMGFDKPVAVINANGSNGWGAAGSQRAVIRKILERVANKIVKNSQIDSDVSESIHFIEPEPRGPDSNSTKDEKLKILWKNGNENFTKQNFSQAIVDFTDLIQLQPNYEYSYRNRGVSYYFQGNYSKALSDLNKSLELKPGDVFTFNYRGWSKYYLKDYIGALADFNLQIEKDPSSTDGYYNRGSVKSELGDENGAITDYSKSIELKPDFSMGYNNRGWAKYKLKKYSEALVDLNKSIELDPSNWVAYDSRQETKYALNDLKGCIDDCTRALSNICEYF